VFLQSEVRYSDKGGVAEGTCFPLKQHLSGSVSFDLRVRILEGTPSTLSSVKLQVAGSGGNVEVAKVKMDKSCPSGCEFNVPLTADLGKVGKSGLQEFRFRAVLDHPNGKRSVASTGWQAFVDGGGSSDDYRSTDFLEARGWYTGDGYANARIESPLPSGPVTGPFDLDVSLRPGAGGSPITSWAIDVDGTEVNSGGEGGFKGSVTIDPGALRLGAGDHVLNLRSSADTGDGEVNSGVLSVPFTVG